MSMRPLASGKLPKPARFPEPSPGNDTTSIPRFAATPITAYYAEYAESL